MSNALEEMRAKLQKTTQGKAPSSTSSGDLYRFWKAETGTTTVLRFLPDLDKDNPFFWRERQMIKIPFASVEGHPEMGSVEVQVPCIEMYGTGQKCPILSETRPWWKTEKEEYARRYWPQKNYIYQGFVREDTINEDGKPENPIRRFMISKSIHKIIEAALLDPEMENLPTSYDMGSDFKIVKQNGGQYANYGTSSFARRESSLTADERDAIDKYGLFDLKGFLPRQPNDEDLRVMYEMFLESMKDGDSVYRLEWASHYKPYGLNVDGNSAPQQSASPAPRQSAPAASEAPSAPAPAAPEEKAEPESNGTDDILAQLRSRINK